MEGWRVPRDETARGHRGRGAGRAHRCGGGGPPYEVALPFAGADPVFENEAPALPFVDYLRLAVKWGGFPGLAPHGRRADVRLFVREMTGGIEPF